MGHWYQIMSIDFHDHAMIGMMLLRQGYTLVFGSSDARKHFQWTDRPSDYLEEKGMPTKLGRCVTT